MAKVKTVVTSPDGLTTVILKGGQRVDGKSGQRLNSIFLELRATDWSGRIITVTRQVTQFRQMFLQCIEVVFRDHLNWPPRIAVDDKWRAIELLTRHKDLIVQALAKHWQRHFPPEE